MTPEDDFDLDDWPDAIPAPGNAPASAQPGDEPVLLGESDLLDELPQAVHVTPPPVNRHYFELPKEGISDSVFPYGVRAGVCYATGKFVGLPKHDAPQPARPKLVAGPPRFDLIALDLDGTLMRSDKKVAMYDVNAIKRAIKRGVKVVIATARPPRSAREIHEQLGLDTPLINYNGALIHDRANRTHLAHYPLAAETARAMVELARTLDPGVVVTLERLDQCFTDHDDPNLQTETAKRFKPDYIGPLDEPLKEDITKLMFLAPGDRLKPIRAAITEVFTGRAAFAESDEHIMQIVNPTVGKGAALAWVADRLGVPAERCLAIGDAPNDSDMLRWAGKGCAVANAFGDARDAADIILVEGNDNEAVGHAIEDFVL